jgi:riboflavin synthase
MFTGIVENQSVIEKIIENQNNVEVWFSSNWTHEFKIDQSIAHNGICLTIDQLEGNQYRITAIEETLKKTTLSLWQPLQKINIERCLKLGDRLDGHIVQGHVDAVADCIAVHKQGNTTEFTFRIAPSQLGYIIEKGSIALDGISLTTHTLIDDTFKVSLIPYTLEYTNAHQWHQGSKINVEFDFLAKYLQRNIQLGNRN